MGTRCCFFGFYMWFVTKRIEILLFNCLKRQKNEAACTHGLLGWYMTLKVCALNDLGHVGFI